MTSLRRYAFRCAVAATVATAYHSTAFVQAEDTYPLRVIVPCAAGTPADLLARHLAKSMQDDWGQHVFVENIPTATDRAGSFTRWPADGRTIVFKLGGCGDEENALPQTSTGR
jgi:tripartite-type tricarboxylate transporter receptor subunit TctC